MVFEGGNISLIKIRILTLFSRLLKPAHEWDADYRSLTLMEAINNSQTFKEMMTNANELVDMITSGISQSLYSGNSTIVLQAVNYIHGHFKDNINLKKIAADIHVNNTYLSTIFRKEMGLPLITYINDLRLTYAAEILKEGNDSIMTIALQSGFKEVSYFTKLFREKYGVTPRQYRSI